MSNEQTPQTTALSLQDKINQDVQKYSVTNQKLAELREYLSLTIRGVDDTEGAELIHKRRMEVRNIRISVEKIRKGLKDEVLIYGRAIDSEAARIKTELEAVENHLDKEETKHEQQKEEIKQSKIREEENRINARVKRLLDMGAIFDGENYSIAHLSITNFSLRNKIDPEFESFMTDAQSAHEEQTRIMLEEKARIDEGERIERERLEKIREEEAAKLKALMEENENRKREQEEERKRLDEIDRQQKEQARILQEQTDKLENEKKAIKQARNRARQIQISSLGLSADHNQNAFRYKSTDYCTIPFTDLSDMEDLAWLKTIESTQNTIRRVKEREEIEEKQKIEEANKKAVEEALAKKQREDEEAEAERKRQLEIATDRDKLIDYMSRLNTLISEYPEVKIAKKTLEEIRKEMLACSTRISNIIKKLK